LVSGSTLLPGVKAMLVERFGEERVRSDHALDAVARGALMFSAGAVAREIVLHTYALRVRNPETGQVAYERLVPLGTPYPTARDFCVRDYPLLTSGWRPIEAFSLPIYRVQGQTDGEGPELVVRSQGSVEWLNPAKMARVNGGEPVLIHLDPPQPARSGRRRVRVAFWIDAERRLCVSVRDLEQDRSLASDLPIAQLDEMVQEG
jgi:hypothetical protein